MNILCIGDVVSGIGCEALRKVLPKLKKDKNIDLVIANGENSADGNGILPQSAERLVNCGVDIITTGNHAFRRKEMYDKFDELEYLIRPANYPESVPGHGMCIYDMGRCLVAVINIMGVVYMEPLYNPFETLDRQLELAKDQGAKIIIVDIHAEATSEKRALGFYADGRASVIFGTHTHVQTADEQILKGGTGYITDLGMCGPEQSVLGVKPEITISKMKTMMPIRFDTAHGDCIVCGCIFTVDEKSGRATAAERIYIRVAE